MKEETKIKKVVEYIKDIARLDTVRILFSHGNASYARAMVFGFCDGAFQKNPLSLDAQLKLANFAEECCKASKEDVLKKKF